ncbi:hypothetical protein N9N67_02540 [Bacteriovoracaceae bacterium]|nr:hypothetical protein [Bacteriovoracaceae bacterium]
MNLNLILPLLLLSIVSCKDNRNNPKLNPSEVNIFHFNIKELDSTKIRKKNKQLKSVKEIISKYDMNIVSFNEVQYDLPQVPNNNYSTTGTNISKLTHILGLGRLGKTSFQQANTGNNALRRSDGSYEVNPYAKGARSLADLVNFGIFPGQYSTGAAFDYPIISETVFTDIKWTDFNPDQVPSDFTMANGEKLPNNMPLFDKNFTDVVLKINKRDVHLILFHTVPSFHFGNKNSPNYVRNQDQLRFLEWYLTGSTDREVKLEGISPLDKDSYFIAIGDWNVDLKSEDSPGRVNLKRILNKTNPWISPSEFSFTNESSRFSPKPFRLMLDYIVVSKNIEVLEGEIIHPKFKREELECRPADDKRKFRKTKKGMTLVSYLTQDRSEICYVLIDSNYYNFKIASDHYPLRAKLKID